ncbi:hypothetical protein LCGC14_0343140 [marine sediment metagenome]|uniref:Uncharacterized protein n=1 Tax=marine sediment metagenome TaxID=412755 RepID=A0A0F9W0E5_9ZZZZ
MNLETMYKLKDVASVVYQMSGIKVAASTPRAWVIKGKRSYTNRLVFLHAEKKLGAWYTKVAWIERFMQELEK